MKINRFDSASGNEPFETIEMSIEENIARSKGEAEIEEMKAKLADAREFAKTSTLGELMLKDKKATFEIESSKIEKLTDVTSRLLLLFGTGIAYLVEKAAQANERSNQHELALLTADKAYAEKKLDLTMSLAGKVVDLQSKANETADKLVISLFEKTADIASTIASKLPFEKVEMGSIRNDTTRINFSDRFNEKLDDLARKQQSLKDQVAEMKRTEARD